MGSIMENGINIHSSRSLTTDTPNKPTVFIVQGRYQNWIKPIMMLEYLNIDYQPVVLSDPDSGTVWYGTIHPYKYLPALIDNVDGERTVLWDSTTILSYLSEQYDPKKSLYGRTMKERLEINNWLIFETASLGPSAKYWVWYTLRKGDAVNPAAQEKMMTDLKRQYSILNQRLEQPGQQWLGLKDRPSIADLSVYPFADKTTLARMELDIAQWPALQDWQGRMAKLPYVEKAYNEMGSREICNIE